MEYQNKYQCEIQECQVANTDANTNNSLVIQLQCHGLVSLPSTCRLSQLNWADLKPRAIASIYQPEKKMSKGENAQGKEKIAQRKKCPKGKMPKGENAQRGKCPEGKMPKGENTQNGKCQEERIQMGCFVLVFVFVFVDEMYLDLSKSWKV